MQKNRIQSTEAIELLEIENILSFEEWTRRKKAHEQRTDTLLSEYLENRSRHQKQPVLDFLFEYYHFRPSKLRNWLRSLQMKMMDYLVIYRPLVNFIWLRMWPT